MSNLSVDIDLSFSILKEKDCHEAVELLTEAFCQHDPIESALQITQDEFRVMVELELEPVKQNGLCLVVRQTATGLLAGVIIAVDALDESVDSTGIISEKFDPINKIARDFHGFYLINRSIQPKSCLYVFMLGVRPELVGKGVGKRLIGEALQNAKNKGYRSAIVMATNLASTNAFENHQFKAIKMLPYQTYQFRNQFVFSSIEKHPGIVLLEREGL